MSALQAHYDSLGLPVQVLVVNFNESMSTTKYIQRTYNIYPPVLNNQSNSVWYLYNMNGYMPLNFVLLGDNDMTVYYWANTMTLANCKYWINLALAASVEETPVVEKYTALKTSSISSNRINIEYSLKNRANIKLTIYDMMGRVIARLSDGIKNSGTYTTTWHPQNNGIYFVKLFTGGEVLTNKVVILK
ncbi:MAG: T9SS type A sorting domain-containing protein [Candidatus Cloacimonadota bacterium]|nr:MAG: T9SS type A sorting domain-containing protein [Candidatus Cloacimonadota bacterium]